MSQQAEDPAPEPELGPSEGGGRALHMRSFKLRFAAHREPGRSNFSAIKPLGLPATVADAPQRVERHKALTEAEEAALNRVRAMFTRGPRDKYGWWWDQASKIATTTFSDRRLNHHIQDSSWLKTRLLILAADDKLKQR
ncbi:unnamed protein product [Diatraea saccharalis]|uniref:Uncharacterized protein n=1 Tax=Diatraea saccharalis TaxID=40085 RepID=A0A9N9QWI5_9NEOP|nr:unnamed protein product [Diatraea saccharalis]